MVVDSCWICDGHLIPREQKIRSFGSSQATAGIRECDIGIYR